VRGEYKNSSERRGNESREEVSHKVAWSAVEKCIIRIQKGNG
jgi:cation transport regulator